MSIEETNVYLEAKRTAQQQQGSEQPEGASPSSKKVKAKSTPVGPDNAPSISQRVSVDMQTVRTVLEEVVHTEVEALRAAMPHPQEVPSLDMQMVQSLIQSTVRTELQGIQTTLTILTNAVQAQADALMMDDAAEGEGDEELLSPQHDTDAEPVKEFPRSEDVEEDENTCDEEEGGEDDGYTADIPVPQPPTHRLPRGGPVALLLGEGVVCHPTEGIRRWERHA